MAKIKTKGLEYPKPKTSPYLCCFGSVHHKTPKDHHTITGSKHNIKPKSESTSWFPWQRIRLGVNNNSMAKTMSLHASEFDDIHKLKLKFKARANEVHSSKWKSKSNSDSLNKTQSNYSTSTKSQQYRGNNLKNDTCQQSNASLTNTFAHAVSLPTSKRHVRYVLSSTHSQTTSNHAKHKQVQNAEGCNPVIATIVITLVSMILWGRLCSILCTSASFYLFPFFTIKPQNDKLNAVGDSNDMISDSKKKIIRRCSTSL